MIYLAMIDYLEMKIPLIFGYTFECFPLSLYKLFILRRIIVKNVTTVHSIE